MKFFAIVATLIAAVAAGTYGTHLLSSLPSPLLTANNRIDEVCSSTIVTVTETVTVPAGGMHTPSAPGSAAPSLPPYPTSNAPYPSVAPTGTGYPVTPVPSGTAAPTGSYTTAPPEFTGAASHAKVGGFVAGVGALAAFFL